MTSEARQTLPKRPTTVDELGALIADTNRSGARLRITGSDSMPLLHFAEDARPVQQISTLRMNKVVEHAVADMTVIVDAGISLEALQRQLAWQNQWLPVDPPALGGRSPAQRTLGGLIATNSLGPLRFGCGDWRLMIMGIKWIDGEGRLITGGGRTVKNVAGYSSPRMLIGSCGTLGVIAQVTLRTFARPADEQCVVVFCDSAEQAEALLASVMLSPTTPAYVQLVGGRTFASNPLQMPSPWDAGNGGEGGMVAIIGFFGRPDVCAGQIESVRNLPEAKGLESISQTAAQAGRLRLWMTTEPAAADGRSFRLYLRPSQVAGAVAALEKLSEPGGWLVSEAGTGVIRGVILGGKALVELERLATVFGGEFIHIGAKPPKKLPIASRIKSVLDPGNVFGAGF